MAAFTSYQQSAIGHGAGPAYILAEPGSGKTTVLAARCAALVSGGVSPSDILMLTFANKNADDFRAKLGEACEGICVMTFHALAYRIMERPALLDFADLVRQSGLASAPGVSGADVNSAALGRFISNASGQGFAPTLEDIPEAARGVFRQARGELVPAWAALERLRKERGVHTFDSVMAGCVMRLCHERDVLARWQNKFRFVLADEFQDANRVQSALLDLLARRHRNIMVVGDARQAIYGWRGAQARFLTEFPARWARAKLYSLPDNFRCKGEVLLTARQVHPESELSLTCGFGGKLDVTPGAALAQKLAEVSRDVGAANVAVLLRTHAQSVRLELALLTLGVQVNLEGKRPFFYRGGAKVLTSALAVLAQAEAPGRARTLLLALRALPFAPTPGLARALASQPLRTAATGELAAFLAAFGDEITRGACASSLLARLQKRFGVVGDEETRALFAAAAGESVAGLLSKLKGHRAEDGVTLTTIHKAKGREWTVVCVPGLERFAVRREGSGAARRDSRADLEERNLLFVALTRASHHLILSGEGEAPCLGLQGERARVLTLRASTLLGRDELSFSEALEIAELVQILGLKRYVEHYFERREVLGVRVRQALAAAAWSPKRGQARRASPYWEDLTPGQPELSFRDVVGAWLN